MEEIYESTQPERTVEVYIWASAHMGKWGQLTPLGKMDEKLKSENVQKIAVFYVYVIF